MTTSDPQQEVTDNTFFQKLSDLETTQGIEIPFDPEEAERLGAFSEKAIDEETALASVSDEEG